MGNAEQEADTRRWVPDVIIYHGHCQDGYTGAWVARKMFGEDPFYFAADHGGSPPNIETIKDKDVLFIDFSYKHSMMLAIAHLAKSVVVLDHHVSAERDLAEFTPFTVGDEASFANAMSNAVRAGLPIVAGFDMKRSGAMLAWDFLFPRQPAPMIVNVVQDRDLWRFELSGAKAISMWLFSHDYSWDNWDAAQQMIEESQSRREVIVAGESIERKHMKDIGELLEITAFMATIDGHEVWCANMPYTMASDAANLLAQRDPSKFGATYYFDSEGTAKFSLRSIKGVGMDVSVICSKFGGGGHKNAGGFEYPTAVYPINLVADAQSTPAKKLN